MNSKPDDAGSILRNSDPEHAWKLLSLVNEWIRHADAKATVTLAFTGALGTLLYNMVKSLASTDPWENGVTIVAALALLGAGVLAGVTLTPRTRTKNHGEPPRVNRLYFAHITDHFGDSRSAYRDVLRALTVAPDDLTGDIADQIHANAEIATIKNKVVTWAIRCVLLAGVSVGTLAVLLAR